MITQGYIKLESYQKKHWISASQFYPHLLYSPDLAPRDLQLLCSLQNALNDKKYWISASQFYPHLLYSPDLAPSDLQLLCSLQNALNDKKYWI